MHVRYTNTQQDFRDGYRALPAAIRWPVKVSSWLFFAVWLLPIAWFAPRGEWCEALGAAIMPGYLLFKTYWKRGEKSGFALVFGVPREVSLTPDAVQMDRVGAAFRYSWSSITEVIVTDRQLLLVIGRRSFIAIPIASFTDAAQVKAFAAEAERLQKVASGAPLGASSAADEIRRTAVAGVRYTLTRPQAAAVLQARAGIAPKSSGSLRSGLQNLFFWLGIFAAILLLLPADLLSRQVFKGIVASIVARQVAAWLFIALLRHQYARRVTHDNLGLTEVLVNPQAILSSSPDEETIIAWTKVTAVQEDVEHLKFHLAPDFIIQCIPRSVFPDETTAAHFLQTSRQFQTLANPVPPAPTSSVPLVETGNPYQPPAT